MGTYKSLALAVLLIAGRVPCCLAASSPGHGAKDAFIPTSKLWKTFESNAKFLRIPRSTASCESTALPEPLTTPNPVIDAAGMKTGLSVSFVIGTDGLVHSALLLESAGPAEDRAVLNVVRSWRYRPALCNGVPTEIEATVDFSSRRSSFGLE